MRTTSAVVSPAKTRARELNNDSRLLPIDAKVTIKGHEVHLAFKKASAPKNIKKEFRFWQVEPLLNQAADLLDRGMRDRAEFNGLKENGAKITLEVEEFEKLQ
jgi:hypothetical protein